MTGNWKALAIGIVGAMGGLGAVSLAAQDGDRHEFVSGGDMVLRAGENALWHVSQGRIRHCRYIESNFGNDVICTNWR